MLSNQNIAINTRRHPARKLRFIVKATHAFRKTVTKKMDSDKLNKVAVAAPSSPTVTYKLTRVK